MVKRIPESDLIVPTLELLDSAPDGEMRTTEIIEALEDRFGPTGEDASILEGRHDTKSSQKVRNLKSHKTFHSPLPTILWIAKTSSIGTSVILAGLNCSSTYFVAVIFTSRLMSAGGNSPSPLVLSCTST